MFAFTTAASGARLLCHAEFSDHQVLNIDFVDQTRGDIPFHLSLRRAEGLLVVNRRFDGAWRRELVWPLVLGPDGCAIDVRFATGKVALWLNGRLIGRFDRLPRA
jgi:hypothetical protein